MAVDRIGIELELELDIESALSVGNFEQAESALVAEPVPGKQKLELDLENPTDTTVGDHSLHSDEMDGMDSMVEAADRQVLVDMFVGFGELVAAGRQAVVAVDKLVVAADIELGESIDVLVANHMIEIVIVMRSLMAIVFYKLEQ